MRTLLPARERLSLSLQFLPLPGLQHLLPHTALAATTAASSPRALATAAAASASATTCASPTISAPEQS